MLAGAVRGGVMYMTHLIVPKQTGSEDNCEMTDEDALLDYCLSKNLITLGWIHSHPSQSCFMSSMDTHTHASFQSTLPEAVAIVVAPRDTKQPYGAFRLTDDPARGSGLELILACELRGFHPHEAAFPIYEASSHVQWTSTELQVADLR